MHSFRKSVKISHNMATAIKVLNIIKEYLRNESEENGEKILQTLQNAFER